MPVYVPHSQARDIVTVGHIPAPVQFFCPTDPDSPGNHRRQWGSYVVVANLKGPGFQIASIVRAADSHRLRQSARAATQVQITTRLDPRRAHQVKTFSRLQGSQKHCRTFAKLAAHNIRAPVDSVTQIHVKTSRRTEHRGITHGLASMRMRRRIIYSGIRLDFHDASGATIGSHQQLVQQGGSQLNRGAFVEFTRRKVSGSDIDTPQTQGLTRRPEGNAVWRLHI